MGVGLFSGILHVIEATNSALTYKQTAESMLIATTQTKLKLFDNGNKWLLLQVESFTRVEWQ